jgi:hypothetical protein
VFAGPMGFDRNLRPAVFALAGALGDAVWGRTRPDAMRSFNVNWSKSLVGATQSLVAPGNIVYQAHALLYSARLGLPLINDDPALPVLGLPPESFRNNTKLLASIMTLECVRLVLPNIPVLSADAIGELRSETKELVRPFRRSMLRLAGDLNASLESATSIRDVVQAARSLAETNVYPELEELREALQAPAKPWHKRAVGFFKDVPDLVTGFATLPMNMAVAKVLVKLTTVLADLRDDELEKRNGAMKRGGLHYLLRLPEVVNKR